MGLLQEKAERMSNAHKMELRDWITGSRVIKNVLFLFSAEGRVYRYQCGELQMIEDELFQNYVCCSENDNIVSAIFCDIVQLKGEFYFISYYRNKIVKYNASTDQFEAVFQSYMEEWNGNRRSYSLCKVINEEKVALYSYYESCFYILDFLDGSVQKKYLEFPVVNRKLAGEDPLLSQMLVNYNYIDNLDVLFILTADKNSGKKEKNFRNKMVGKQIYKFVNKCSRFD